MPLRSQTPSRSQMLSSHGTVDSIYSQSQYSESSESTSASSVDDMQPAQRPILPGIYVPSITTFHEATEDLDLNTINMHVKRLGEAGVAGIVVQGSNGEAVHLTRQERKLVTKHTRKALDGAGYQSLPVIVGCSAQSTRETIELCREASASGGDYALILPPSYYKSLYGADTLIEFFQDVADASPIPVLIYNFPGGAGGTDMDSDAITQLARHSNIVGCKYTCGNTGKLCRVASAVNAATPFKANSGFMCLGGSADFILQTLVVGGSGVICGLANIAPKACVKVVDLYVTGKMEEAKKLQAVLAQGDNVAITGGVIGTKSALETFYGYGGFARRPLPRPAKEDDMKYARDFKELMDLEKSL